MNSALCRVLEKQALNEEVVQVKLSKPKDWKAGQYLRLVYEDKPYAFFTIANAANQDYIELHIQQGEEGSDSLAILQDLEPGREVEVEMAMGKVEPEQFKKTGSLVLVASGTCFSQIKAITEHYLTQGSDRKLYLYWAVAHLHELYFQKQAESWEVEHGNISFTAIVSKQQHWDQRHCLLKEAIKAEVDDLINSDIVICGSPTMVNGLMEELSSLSLNRSQFHSDTFEFA